MWCNKIEINCLNRENCCLALFMLILLSDFVILLSFFASKYLIFWTFVPLWKNVTTNQKRKLEINKVDSIYQRNKVG